MAYRYVWMERKQIGNVGVHKDQALIIINIGNATGTEIMELSNKIRASVLKKV